MSKNTKMTTDYRATVMQCIRDYILQKHEFPSITEISKITELPKSRCAKICKELAKQNQLYPAFKGRGLPTIYVPHEMMQSLLTAEKKPDWITKYAFKDEDSLREQIEELNSKLVNYDIFRKLLYATGMSLEESVAFTLKWLGFENVTHYKEDPDNPDITFEYEGKKVLVEVEGTTKAGTKEKVLQLESWITREIIKGKKYEELQGIYVINHFREIEPNSREDPLSPQAKELLKHYGFKFFTTPFLFYIVRQVIDEGLPKENAQIDVWKGEKIG